MTEDNIDESIEPIAIIGMACRLPDASDIYDFRENLKKGKESVTFFTKSEMIEAGADYNLVTDPHYVTSGCILEDIEMFDCDFFGYTADKAELIDPQQRIMLECAYEALENAGCLPQKQDGDIGVFGGMRTSGYANVLSPVLKKPGSMRAFEAVLGTSVDQLCMRISHALDLRGPSIGIQTACSGSAVAIHLACESLRNGECCVALAGASSIFVPQKRGFLYDPDLISSLDGHCRAFDAKAQGTIAGNGAGMVVLRRLSDAIKKHDYIYAIIRGNAINNDGSVKAAYRAPSVEGQARVIEEALLISGVDAESITYVEANGTGTLLGDSIEIEALSRIFQMTTDKKQFCGIGSVKTNIGHLTQAAGVAALIKTVLSLKYRELYPSLNYETPNPSLTDCPFYVVQKLSKWNADNSPRRASLNSFAIGGTNAHLVLEEAPLATQTPLSKNKNVSHILTVSVKKEASLRNMVRKYKSFLESKPDATIEDICFTSNVGRLHYPWRFSAVTRSKEELLKHIDDWLINKNEPHILMPDIKKDIPQIVFLFSDSSDTHFLGMNSFYGRQTCFKEAIDQCQTILKRINEMPFSSSSSEDFDDDGTNPVNIFVTEYALFTMWESWGVIPVAVAGAGIGKYVAACVSGALTLEDGLRSAIKDDFSTSSIPDSDSRDSSLVPAIEFVPSKDEILKRQNPDILIHIGPEKNILGTNVSLPKKVIVHAYQGDNNEWRDTLMCLGELYVRGKDINWDRVTEALPYYKTPLPAYPFDRKSCWFNG